MSRIVGQSIYGLKRLYPPVVMLTYPSLNTFLGVKRIYTFNKLLYSINSALINRGVHYAHRLIMRHVLTPFSID